MVDKPAPWTPLVRLDPQIDRRHTNRRDFLKRMSRRMSSTS
jgi:hypothetical protein